MPESALKRTIDFSNVGESRSPSAHVTPGDYLLEVESVEIKKSNNGPWENANWQFSIVGAPGAGVVYENTTLKTEGLFRLRDLLVAMGMPVKAKHAIDFAKFIGKTVGGTLIDNDYTDKDGNARTNSKVGAFFPASRLPAAGIVSTTAAAPAAGVSVASTSYTGPSNGTAAISGDEIASADDEAVEELEFVDEAI